MDKAEQDTLLIPTKIDMDIHLGYVYKTRVLFCFETVSRADDKVLIRNVRTSQPETL